MNNDLPREIERKYIIKRPTAQLLESIGASHTEILQTYLAVPESGAKRRVRKRGSEQNGWVYTYTEKTDVSFGERIEIEREINREEYETLIGEASPDRPPIEKTRYVFKSEGQTFELDIYPFSEELAVLEIELDSIDREVKLPEFLEVIRDVTGDKRYENSQLAAAQKLELLPLE